MQGEAIDIVFSILVLIMSVVVHEVSHGFVANILGDKTALLAGRLTLNPIKHLDPMGSFIVPILVHFASAGSFIFGWAKPVPYNPHNLKGNYGDAKVAAAGPLSNLLLAVIFGLLLRFAPVVGLDSPAVIKMLTLIVFLNLVLMVFNLVPIPPLDGSKVLFSLLPYHLRYIQEFLERYWLVLLAVFVLFLWDIVAPIVFFFFSLITGVG